MGETCEHGPELRELLTIGDGFVMDFTPRTKVSRAWAVSDDPDLPLGESPVAGGPSAGLWPRTFFVPVGKRRLLLVQTDTSDATIFTVNTNTPSSVPGDILLPTLGEGVLEGSMSGRNAVGLDDDSFIVYRTGTGAYSVYAIDERAADTPQVLVRTGFHGTRPELRRGARVVNLGNHRLLVWVPLTGHYQIWAYTLDEPARADIFDTSPLAEGDFPPEITRNHELLVPVPGRILVWDRDTGKVQLRQILPTATDPLNGAIVGEHQYPQLKSPDWAPDTKSAIKNLVVVLQRGRSFDAYFGQVCKQPPGSAPSCEEGPDCCEGMPTSIPGAAACTPLDATADTHVPKADFRCMQLKTASADAYATPDCGDPSDFACTPPGDGAGAFAFYHRAAEQGALADRFFQSTLDGPEQNLIYLSKTAWGANLFNESGWQITRIMAEHNVRWGLYLPDADETRNHPPPIFFDHHWDFFRGTGEFDRDVDLEQLPAITIVLPGPAESELPGAGPAEVGIRFAEHVVTKIADSKRYAPTTLVLLAHLSSGGFFDHVAPPPAPDAKFDTREGAPVAYGPRVPLLALGRFARPGHVSHVQLELSSITRFMEWNWRNGLMGEIGHRDMIVSNIGSLLDPAQTGTPVP